MHSGTTVHGKRLTLLLIGYGNSVLSFHGGNVPIQRAFKTGFVEHDRMKRLREAADALKSGLDGLKNFLQIGAQCRALGGMRSGAAQHRSNRSKDLSELIVEFTRDVAKSRFLGGNQFLGEFAAALRNFGETREEAAVPANERKAIQQDGEQRCAEKEIYLSLDTIVNLD